MRCPVIGMGSSSSSMPRFFYRISRTPKYRPQCRYRAVVACRSHACNCSPAMLMSVIIIIPSTASKRGLHDVNVLGVLIGFASTAGEPKYHWKLQLPGK